MAEIKAIETIYNGYRFRSRLEARWAVFFDALGLEYNYELEGFVLPSGRKYLPDFFLPQSKMFVEVKGNMDDSDGISKAHELDNYPPDYAIMGCIVVHNLELVKYTPPTYEGEYFIFGDGYNEAFGRYNFMSRRVLTADEINTAVKKARQARFEHGEKG